jgi:hypothetical protein
MKNNFISWKISSEAMVLFSYLPFSLTSGLTEGRRSLSGFWVQYVVMELVDNTTLHSR